MVDIVNAFALALGSVLTPTGLLFIFIGSMFGMFMGLVPGLGGVTAIALLIPITFGMDPALAFMLLAGTKGGEAFGGSVSAILLNVPGTSPNAATLLDGYPMTRNGEAARALAASATSSAFGAMVGILVLAATIPVMLQASLLFGPPEIFWLGVWGITVISLVVGDDILWGLASGGLGVFLAIHGQNIITGTPRWTYGFTFMYDGFSLVPTLIGIFAIAEMINLLSEGQKISGDESLEIEGSVWQGIKDTYIHRWLFLRSAIIGTVVGIIPGVGGAAANYIAYFQAIQTVDNSERFGEGDVRGVIASEASNDAKDGGAFIPTLAFGIPGSASMAVLLGAFVLHGMIPGPQLMQQHSDIVAVIIIALLISNVMTSSVGLLVMKQLAFITKVRIEALAPAVLIVAFFGAFALGNNPYDLLITLIAGIMGYVMIEIDMPRVPLVLALVLTPIIEENFFRSLQISDGAVGYFGASTVSKLFIGLTMLSLFLPYIKSAISDRGAIIGE